MIIKKFFFAVLLGLFVFIVIPAHASSTSTPNLGSNIYAAAQTTATAVPDTASSVAAATPASTPSAQPQVVGHVVWVKGSFKAEVPGQSSRTLQRQSVIYLHDTLTTSASSQAQIVFTDNSLMVFRPQTVFRIDNYHFDTKNPTAKNGKYGMKLVKGGLRTVTGWIGKSQPDNYKINTPVATIGVRGTEFSVFFGEDKKLSVQLKVGSLKIGNAAGTTVLDLRTNKVFAEVASVAQRPIVVQQQPAVFKNEPTLVPATSPGTPAVPSGPVSPAAESSSQQAQPANAGEEGSAGGAEGSKAGSGEESQASGGEASSKTGEEGKPVESSSTADEEAQVESSSKSDKGDEDDQQASDDAGGGGEAAGGDGGEGGGTDSASGGETGTTQTGSDDSGGKKTGGGGETEAGGGEAGGKSGATTSTGAAATGTGSSGTIGSPSTTTTGGEIKAPAKSVAPAPNAAPKGPVDSFCM